jgi:hypothetical protein
MKWRKMRGDLRGREGGREIGANESVMDVQGVSRRILPSRLKHGMVPCAKNTTSASSRPKNLLDAKNSLFGEIHRGVKLKIVDFARQSEGRDWMLSH